MKNDDINIDINRLITLEFQDGTVLDVQIVDHKLSKKQDVYLINHESPLAKAILDKRKGDKIRFRSDNKIQEVTILEVIEKPKHFS